MKAIVVGLALLALTMLTNRSVRAQSVTTIAIVEVSSAADPRVKTAREFIARSLARQEQQLAQQRLLAHSTSPTNTASDSLVMETHAAATMVADKPTHATRLPGCASASYSFSIGTTGSDLKAAHAFRPTWGE